MSDTPPYARLIRILRPSRRKILCGVLAGLIGLGLYWWYDGGRYMFIPRRFAAVEEGAVYRSAQLHQRLIEDVLTEHKIQVILDMAPDAEDDEDARVERTVAERLGIQKVNLLTLDGSGRGDPADYVLGLETILAAKRAGRPILVHCAAGTQRTGALVGLYRMLYQGWSGERAFAEYMSFRRNRPEHGHLEAFLAEHLPRIMDDLVASGALPRPLDPPPHFGPTRK